MAEVYRIDQDMHRVEPGDDWTSTVNIVRKPTNLNLDMAFLGALLGGVADKAHARVDTQAFIDEAEPPMTRSEEYEFSRAVTSEIARSIIPGVVEIVSKL